MTRRRAGGRRAATAVALVVVVGSLAVAVSGGSAAAGGATPTTPAVTLAAEHGSGRSPGCGRAPAAADVLPGHDQARTLTVGSVRTTYQLAVPPRYRPDRPVPLILLFYGFDSDPAQFTTLTGLPDRGAAAGSLVVVPHTHPGELEWQFNGNGTDAAFVEALTRHVEDAYCVDPDQVDAAGFSAGAAFTVLYSCAHPGQVAAIATVAVEFLLGCSHAVPILSFHGTSDANVPYQDGAVGISLPGVKVPGTQRNMDAWAALDRCRPDPESSRVAAHVVRQRWSGCADGTSVTLYSILGGGHSWPGADEMLDSTATQEVDATGLILAFFDRHGGPSPTG
ncbi:MAG: alpha/beta hydrolase family esterase [Acidimicrobiales bacterium]